MKLNYKILFPVTAAIVVIGALFGLRLWNDYKNSNFEKEYVIFVHPGMTEAEVLDSIYSNAGVKNTSGLQRCFDKLNVAENLKPGKYKITPGQSSIYVARMLVNGWTIPQNLTLSGTMRSNEVIARKISNQMMVDSITVLEALQSEEFLADYGFTPENVFALFLPDTYELQWDDDIEVIFARMKKEYDRFWTEERLNKAKRLGLTQMEVSVLASIVSGETNVKSEYPTIAGVYLNRYRIGMRLQADPTVAYCFDYKLDRILKKHTEIDSPYNTYKYTGLPPTPINVPPKACVDAVLNPDNHSYLYFCASPEFDGTHRFAVTFAEHKKNAREFQRALTKIQKEKAS